VAFDLSTARRIVERRLFGELQKRDIADAQAAILQQGTREVPSNLIEIRRNDARSSARRRVSVRRLTASGAVWMDILHLPARVVVTAAYLNIAKTRPS
jgi:hypothetical protein